MKRGLLSKKIAMVVLVGALLSALVLAALPRTWSVERSITIAAPEEKIAPLIVDLRRWQDWSPWNKANAPLARFTYEGPTQGVGARWRWLGPVMGRGALEVTSAIPGFISLDQALDGDQVNAHATFSFQKQGENTVVTWRDSGELPFFSGVFVGTVEATMEKQMQSGLEKLKASVE